MYEKCFYFLLNSSFLGKIAFLGKLKLIKPPAPLSITTIVQSPPLLILFKNFLAPPPFKIVGDYAFCMRGYKGETIKLLPFYMTDFLFTELKSITFEEN